MYETNKMIKCLLFLALTVRYLTRRFITEYANGIDSAYVHNVTVRGKSIDVKIIDHGVEVSLLLSTSYLMISTGNEGPKM